MPLLDIEKIIAKDNLNSRFRLVHIAGLRARELNTPKEDTVRRQNEEHSKVTTTALSEIIAREIDFIKTSEDEDVVEHTDE